MEIKTEDLEKILKARENLIKEHSRYRDYKNNKNAIMKEADHILLIESTIKRIDEFLEKYVEFK
jgi:hypothetical protein